MRFIPSVSALKLLLLSSCLLAFQSFGQPGVPPGKKLRAPDISTIPGATTMKAKDFDLEGSSFVLIDGTTLAIDTEAGTQAKLSLRPRIPGGSYTFIVDAVIEAQGQASFWLQVGDKKLEAKKVPLRGSPGNYGPMSKLMWTETPYAFGESLTIYAEAAKEGETFTSVAKWTRLIMIPHNQQPRLNMPPGVVPPSGGPRGSGPPAGKKD